MPRSDADAAAGRKGKRQKGDGSAVGSAREGRLVAQSNLTGIPDDVREDSSGQTDGGAVRLGSRAISETDSGLTDGLA